MYYVVPILVLYWFLKLFITLYMDIKKRQSQRKHDCLFFNCYGRDVLPIQYSV